MKVGTVALLLVVVGTVALTNGNPALEIITEGTCDSMPVDGTWTQVSGCDYCSVNITSSTCSTSCWESSGLQALWTFHEGSGSASIDLESSVSMNLPSDSKVQWVSNGRGVELTAHSPNDGIKTGDTAMNFAASAIASSDEISIELWWSEDSGSVCDSNGDPGRIFSWADGTSGQDSFSICHWKRQYHGCGSNTNSQDMEMRFRVDGETQEQISFTSGAVFDGRANHFVLTLDGSTRKGWLNGQLVANSPMSGTKNPNPPSGHPISILGLWDGNQRSVIGQVYMLAVYDEILPDSVILDHYEAGHENVFKAGPGGVCVNDTRAASGANDNGSSNEDIDDEDNGNNDGDDNDGSGGSFLLPLLAGVAGLGAIVGLGFFAARVSQRPTSGRDLLSKTGFDSAGTRASLWSVDTKPLVEGGYGGPVEGGGKSLLREFEHLLTGPYIGVPLGLVNSVKLSEQRELPRQLVVVTHRAGAAEPLVRGMIERHIQECEEESEMFRSASFVSQFLTAYANLVGSVYLQKTLSEPLKQLLAKDDNRMSRFVELDASKATEEEVENSKGEMAGFVESVVEALVKSTHTIPNQLRAVCTIIRREVGKKFRGSGESQVASFLLLRFIAPAIVAPHKAGLARSPPGPNTLRTLVLVTKMLQAIAWDNVLGMKEEYMGQMERLRKAHKSEVEGFLKEISSGRESLRPMDVGQSPKEEKTAALKALFAMARANRDEINLGADVPSEVVLALDGVLHRNANRPENASRSGKRGSPEKRGSPDKSKRSPEKGRARGLSEGRRPSKSRLQHK